jgi:hypothetical protein
MLLFAIEDSNFTMHIRIVIEKEKQIILNSFFYKVYINFAYKKSSAIDVARVPNNILNNLLEKYRNLLNSELFMKCLSNSKRENKSIINKIKEIFNYKKISPGFFRAIDIISIDGFSSKSIGRTIIELDADIINMLPVLTSEKLLHFRLLHNYNVLLVNQTFSYQSKVLQKRLLWIRGIARTFSPFIPLIFQYAYNIGTETDFSNLDLLKYQDLLLNLVPSFIGSILGYFWYRYGPELLIKILINYVFGKAFK